VSEAHSISLSTLCIRVKEAKIPCFDRIKGSFLLLLGNKTNLNPKESTSVKHIKQEKIQLANKHEHLLQNETTKCNHV